MREIAVLILNYSFFALLTELLAGFQSSLWLHVFGYFPAPYAWIAVLNYWILYRSVYEAIIMCYLVAFAVVTMSGASIEMAIGINLTVLAVISVLRNRILWSGPNSFMLASGISALIIPVASFILSFLLERTSVADFYFYDWVLRALLTSAFSLPLFYIFILLDKATRRESPKDTESEVM
jgi:hypothetical protein